jgi:hypothetical protein
MLADGAAVASAVQDIAISIETIEHIASSTMSQVEADTTSAMDGFRSTPVSTANFGDVPLAAELAAQHHAAHEVFVETIQGVLQDLRDFQANLLASARAHQGTDDAAYASLVALGNRYAGHDFQADRNWVRGRREHADELPPAVGDEGGPDAGAGPGDGSGPAPGSGDQGASPAADVRPAAPDDGTGF